jgi:hypothetical protein
MRIHKRFIAQDGRFQPVFFLRTPGSPLKIDELPAPLPIAKVSPDEMIEDIILSTLRRVQQTGSPELAAAASSYISLFSAKDS